MLDNSIQNFLVNITDSYIIIITRTVTIRWLTNSYLVTKLTVTIVQTFHQCIECRKGQH